MYNGHSTRAPAQIFMSLQKVVWSKKTTKRVGGKSARDPVVHSARGETIIVLLQHFQLNGGALIIPPAPNDDCSALVRRHSEPRSAAALGGVIPPAHRIIPAPAPG